MSTTRNTDTVEVIMTDQRRRRWSFAEKAALVRRSYELGMSVSLVARQEGVAASCTSQCPSSWWNTEKFVGAAGLLQAGRFIVDSRDRATRERLDDLDDVYRLFRCRSIMNCTEVCPKGLAPSRAIEKIRLMLVKESF